MEEMLTQAKKNVDHVPPFVRWQHQSERRTANATSTTHHMGLDRPRPTKVKSPSQIRHDVNQILHIFLKHGHQIRNQMEGVYIGPTNYLHGLWGLLSKLNR